MSYSATTLPELLEKVRPAVEAASRSTVTTFGGFGSSGGFGGLGSFGQQNQQKDDTIKKAQTLLKTIDSQLKVILSFSFHS